jgi:hypothetical protein
MTNKTPQDDWEEPNLEHLSSQMKGMKLPPGFIPQANEQQPGYVPNSPAGAYIPQNNRANITQNAQNFQTPEEIMAYMNNQGNQMLNPNFKASTIKPTFMPQNQTSNINPLMGYTRQPGIHVMLPSKGMFNQGEINFEINGEIAVLPMRTSDEILLKNPDALMSGHAIENLIKSCVPGISNPRSLPVSDIDVLLMAIRNTTYGNNMEFEAECPECKNKTEYNVNIRELLETITFHHDQYIVNLDDGLTAYIKPHVLEDQTKLNIATFQEAKKMQFLDNDEISEDTKVAKFNESIKRLQELGIDITANSIIKIVTPETEVTDKNFIKDFLRNCARNYTKKIDDCIKEVGAVGFNKKKKINCTNEKCKHEWEADIAFDPSNFFD